MPDQTKTASESVLRCFRGACDNAAHPSGYNRITHGLYCRSCAHHIERERDRDMAPFFPLLDTARDLPDGGSWTAGIILVRS